MAETSPVLPSNGQSSGVSNINGKKIRKKSALKKFQEAFLSRKFIDENEHPLYHEYRPYAESFRITIQMLIGVILFVVLLLRIIVYFSGPGQIPLLQLIASKQPLELIAYGLFFSTGVDLAYMLFTPGPDEAIEPVMTGLAAAILLYIGNIDYSKIDLQHGIILFLAVAALAGLFATKKYLYLHSDEKHKNNVNKDALTSKTSE